MSSVSVLLPHPPLTSAARKLALALAESAQKASSVSQRKSYAPLHPLQKQEPHAYDRPQRPSVLDLKVHPEEYCSPHVPSVSQWQASVHSPMETQRFPHPVHFIPSHLGSEPVQAGDGQESVCNFTPNVSPLGSGSFDEGTAERRDRGEEKQPGEMTQTEHTYQSVGVSTPSQPFCSAQSMSPSPVYANTDSVDVFNFRSVLAESSMPASIEEIFPRPAQTSAAHHYTPEDNRPLEMVQEYSKHHHHHHHHHRPTHAGRMPASHCPRPNALPVHLSRPKGLYRQSSDSRYSTLGLRHPLSPQYRRYHRDEHLASGYHSQLGQWQRSEDRVVVHPAIRRARSFHAPQFSRYELADADALPPDAMFYVEQMASREMPYQRLIQTGLHPVHTDYYYNPYSDVNPGDGSRFSIEPCRQSGVHHGQSNTTRSTREGGPSDYYNYSPLRVAPLNRELYIESRDTVVYEARDAEVFERVMYQPVKQERKPRHNNTYQAVSPCESPDSPTDTKNRDIMHTRSTSDPGNASLISTYKKESQNAVVTSPTSLRSQQKDPEVIRQQSVSGADSGALRRLQIKEGSSQQQLLRKVPSLPERACPNLNNIKHSDRSHIRGHDQDRLMTSNAGSSYSGAVKPSILRRPRRSQSTREHYYHYHTKSPLDPEHLGCCSTQPSRRTQSTKVRPTQHEHMEGYYASPRPKPTRSSKAVAGYLPGQSCMSPHGQRLLSKALSREAFYHAALRSDAGVYE